MWGKLLALGVAGTLAVAVPGAGDPVSAPARAAASAERPPLFGFNDNSVGFRIASADAVMRRAAEVPAPGGAVYRFTVDWQHVERRDDEWRWGRYDDVYDRALEHGLRPLPILLNAPEWARGVAGACEPGRRDCISPPGRSARLMGEWREFAGRAARRWRRAAAIEVWNEPNTKGFWTTVAGADPAYYGEVLCHAHRAIRAADPGMTVLVGGLANPPTDPLAGAWSLSDFLGALYAADVVGRCADAIGLHPYPAQRRPDGARSHFLSHLRQARAAIAAAGDAGRPLWITEFGYFTGSSLIAAFAEQRAPISEIDQARWLTCAYRLAAGMPDVRAFLLHTLFDRGLDPLDPEQNFGLNRHPSAAGGARKPAHGAFADLFTRQGASVSATERCD